MSYNKSDYENNVATNVTKNYALEGKNLKFLQNKEYSNHKKPYNKQILTENSFSQDEIDIREVDSPDELIDNNFSKERSRRLERNNISQDSIINQQFKGKKMSNNLKYNSSDNYGIVPRVGSKSKTIVIQDEDGNELSRIVSSKDRRNFQNYDLNGNENFNLQPNAMNSLVLQPNGLQPFVVQPTPTPVILQPPGYYVDPNVTNPVFYTSPIITTPRAALSSQIIPEEAIEFEHENSRFYRKLTGR